MLIWTRPHMVQQYHLGANIVLAYFHYCNRGTYPFSDECKESELKGLADLNEDAVDLVGWTREQANNKFNSMSPQQPRVSAVIASPASLEDVLTQ